MAGRHHHSSGGDLGARWAYLDDPGCALSQAASPLVLLPQLQSDEGDLNLVFLLWLYPLPVLAGLMLGVDLLSIARRNKRVHAAENMVLPPPGQP